MQTPEKTIEILTKEIESLNSAQTHDLVLFYYKINHQHYNITTYDKFNEFLESFDKNPFRRCDDKDFKKQKKFFYKTVQKKAVKVQKLSGFVTKKTVKNYFSLHLYR